MGVGQRGTRHRLAVVPLTLAVLAGAVVLFLQLNSGFHSSADTQGSGPVTGTEDVPFTPGERGAPSPGCAGVDVGADVNLKEIVESSPDHTTFCLRTGTYRLQTIEPKVGDTFIGAGDLTVLNGSRLLTNFKHESRYWYVDDQSQQGQVHGECWQVARCNHPEDLFVDDQPFVHVSSKSRLGPGRWYFDYGAHRIYIGEDPGERKIETSVLRHAFYAIGQNDITIKNLVVEKYAPPAQFGAIQSGDFDEPRSSGWLIDGVTARLNHGAGIAFFADDNSTIQHSKMLANGQKGLGAEGRGLQILDNELAYNNYQRAFDPGWEAGGSKFSLTDGLVVRGNDVHDNHGPGLWTDGENVNSLYEDNRVVANGQDGIFHEVSYHAIIRNNVIEGNGFERKEWCYGAGITISASRDVEVYGNTLKDNFNSISGIQQRRGSGPLGAYEIRNLFVHDNVVQGTGQQGAQSQVGPCQDYQAGIYTADWQIIFDHNQYYGTANKWVWRDPMLDFSAWQSDGQDRAGALHADEKLP